MSLVVSGQTSLVAGRQHGSASFFYALIHLRSDLNRLGGWDDQTFPPRVAFVPPPLRPGRDLGVTASEDERSNSELSGSVRPRDSLVLDGLVSILTLTCCARGQIKLAAPHLRQVVATSGCQCLVWFLVFYDNMTKNKKLCVSKFHKMRGIKCLTASLAVI